MTLHLRSGRAPAGIKIEDARYSQVLLKGIQVSLYGKPEEVEELIKCGAYIKDASAMLHKEAEAIKASAVPST